MNKLGPTIIEKGINEQPTKKRETVRAIILNNGKVKLLYSKMFNDYTFPGGGIKENEDHEKALIRELEEELGAKEIKVIKPIGFTEEVRYGINSTNNIYKQTSYYYLVTCGKYLKPKYVGREKIQGLKSLFIKPEKAIKHNNLMYEIRNKNDEKGFKTVLKRENLVLKYIKDNYEKI